MKKIFFLVPLFLVSCQEKPRQVSSIFAHEDDEMEETVQEQESEEEWVETSDNEEKAFDKEDFNAGVPDKGERFLDFTMTDLEGRKRTLSSIVKANKITLVDCWASWCGPCMHEMQNVSNVYRKYHNLGLEIVGVSLDTDTKLWNSAVKNNDMTWPQLSDLKGWESEVATLYNIDAIPCTILIGNNGKILGKNLRGENLVNAIADALKK